MASTASSKLLARGPGRSVPACPAAASPPREGSPPAAASPRDTEPSEMLSSSDISAVISSKRLLCASGPAAAAGPDAQSKRLELITAEMSDEESISDGSVSRGDAAAGGEPSRGGDAAAGHAGTERPGPRASSFEEAVEAM